MTDDVFRPRHYPARRIYDAFQEEAKLRGGRSQEEWQTKEVMAVLHAARITWPTVSLTLVEQAQTYAQGHTDYGAKWAYRICELAGASDLEGSASVPEAWVRALREYEHSVRHHRFLDTTDGYRYLVSITVSAMQSALDRGDSVEDVRQRCAAVAAVALRLSDTYYREKEA